MISEAKPDYGNIFSDCFGELGRLPIVHHITVDPNVSPGIHSPRRIPVALQDTLKCALDKMVKSDVIEPITEPTEWVSSLVIVKKNGSLRLCLDPKDLNKAIKREPYQMPTTESILLKLDASNAYWQIPVDEESSRLLTFNSPYGRYCFK